MLSSKIKRRQVLALVGSAAAGWPLPIRAQQADSVRRVGILLAFPENDADVQQWVATFAKGLRGLGWTESNVQVDTHLATADIDRINRAARELIDRKPDVILASGPLPVAALRPIAGTIPIVFISIADPVGSGFVASLAQPGGNMTGFTAGEFTTSGKMLDILKQVTPTITRAAVIYNPQQVPQVGRLGAIQAVAPALGVQVSGAGASNFDQLKQAIETLSGETSTGVVVLSYPVTIANRALIISAMARQHKPAVYDYPIFGREGGLVSYGNDNVAQFAQAASYVDRILKGAKPADLPVQQPTKFVLVVNLKTAKALGLTVPQSLLASADEVIE